MFHMSSCCCEGSEPCETCSIECAATNDGATPQSPPLPLPEYLRLNITVTSGTPDCCGGDWATGCWLLRNASAFLVDGNCAAYIAVDPNNLSSPLYALKGVGYDGITSETCISGDSDQPYLILAEVDGNGTGDLTAIGLRFHVSDFTELDPGLIRGGFMDYEYSAPGGGINLCDTGIVTLSKAASSALECSVEDPINDPATETYWPENCTLEVVECDDPTPTECNDDPGIGIDSECCTGVYVPARLPFAIVGPFPASTTLVYDSANVNGPGWYGSVVVPGGCGGTWPISLRCLDGEGLWSLSIDGDECRVGQSTNATVQCDPFLIITPLDPRECETESGAITSGTLLPCSYLVIGDDPSGGTEASLTADISGVGTGETPYSYTVTSLTYPTDSSFEATLTRDSDPGCTLQIRVTLICQDVSGTLQLRVQVEYFSGGSWVTETTITLTCTDGEATFNVNLTDECGEVVAVTMTLNWYAAAMMAAVDEPQQSTLIASRGLGDTIKKITDATGITKIAKAYERLTGKPCGCSDRQEKLNERFPYKSSGEDNLIA